MKILALLLLLIASVACESHAQATQPEWCSKLPRAGFAKLHRVPVQDAWFEIYEVSKSTYAIYEPRQSEETIGYLIVGSKRAVLFDTGMGIGDLKKLTSQLTTLPIVVLNSHTHGDHVGGNWQFSDVYSMDTPFSRESAKGSSEQAREEIRPSELCGDVPAGFDTRAYVTRPWNIARYIHDKEQIDLGGRSVEVIATPGHTPDAICLFDKANGLLFTGDTYYPGTIWLYRPETDLAAYGRSVHRLAMLAPQVKQVLGAHNFPLTSPEILPRLPEAWDSVRAGAITSVAAGDGKVKYVVGDISFLMKAP